MLRLGGGKGRSGGYTPLVHLLVQIGDAVLDAEDVHELLGEGAGNRSMVERLRSVVFRRQIPSSGAACEQHVEGGRDKRTIAGGGRWASSPGRVLRRSSCCRMSRLRPSKFLKVCRSGEIVETPNRGVCSLRQRWRWRGGSRFLLEGLVCLAGWLEEGWGRRRRSID